MNVTSSAPALVQRILILDSTLRVSPPLVGAARRLSSETGVCVSRWTSTLQFIIYRRHQIHPHRRPCACVQYYQRYWFHLCVSPSFSFSALTK